jgi:hypothetical protein
MTSARLEGYKPGANIRISKGVKLRDVISKLFSVSSGRRDVKTGLRQQCVTY